MDEKRISVIAVVVGIVILMAIGIGASYLVGKKPIESASVSSEKNLLKPLKPGWQVYTDAELKFGISYPEDWDIKISIDEISLTEKRTYFSLMPKQKIESAPLDKALLCNVCIGIWNYKYEEGLFNLLDEDQRPVIIDGISGYQGTILGIENKYASVVEYNNFTYIIGSYFQDLDETERLVKNSFQFLR